MGVNLVQQVIMSQQEKAELELIENLKRKGHKFIRIASKLGFIRLHAVDSVKANVIIDPVTQQKDYRTSIGSSPIEMSDETNFMTDVLDTEFNRYFLSRHLNEIEILDKDIEIQIRKLVNKKYRVELSEEELIEKEIDDLQRKKEDLLRRKAAHKEAEEIRNRIIDENGEDDIVVEKKAPEENVKRKVVSKRRKAKRNIVTMPSLHEKPESESESIEFSAIKENVGINI